MCCQNITMTQTKVLKQMRGMTATGPVEGNLEYVTLLAAHLVFLLYTWFPLNIVNRASIKHEAAVFSLLVVHSS